MMSSLTGALGLGIQDPSFWMPLVLVGLFYAAIVAGAVLDGFDIGVGCLLPFASMGERARMLSLLSPWRDANEFWLFLGLGLLAAAFPHAWALIMGALYIPLTLLGVGVLLRSASFELRLRAPQEWQPYWSLCFAVGAWLTAMSHGLILGRVVTAYAPGVTYGLLGVFFALAALAAYCLLGAAWLIMREAGELRVHAVIWARRCVRWAAAGVVAVSIVLMLVHSGVFLRWSNALNGFLIILVWASLLACFVLLEMMLQRMIAQSPRTTTLPFLLVLLIFFIILGGLGYSFFPYLILDDMTIWDGAASLRSLKFVLWAAVIVLPVAIVFNIRVYWGMFGLSRPPEPPPFSG